MNSPQKNYQHNLNRKSINKNATYILKKLVKSGFEAYLVGGAVRDAEQGIQPKDFDIATDAHPEQIRKVFRNSRIIGRRFKLVHVYFSRRPSDYIEVATFRSNAVKPEHSNNGLIMKDNVYGTLEEDAVRRDFTVNALYYDWHENCIIDFHGGLDDINKKIVRLIGKPELRYQEDPVRMLRGIRFMAKLGFKLETKTEKPIKNMANLLQNIPAARLYEEYLKLFHSGYASKTFELLRHYGLFYSLFPQTSDSLKHYPDFTNLVTLALVDTDSRLNSGLSINHAYLLAVFLWQDVTNLFTTESCEDLPPSVCFGKKANKILRIQKKSISVPKFLASFINEVWTMQLRMNKIVGKSPFKVLQQARFRAAFDFLCLRYRAGETELADLVDFWSEFQDANLEKRGQMTKLKPIKPV